MRFITEDLIHFWEAVDHLDSASDTTAVFQKLVIDRATEPYKIFISKWKIKASDLHRQLSRYPRFYQSIRKRCEYLVYSRDSVLGLVQKFSESWPDVVPAQVVVGMGNFRTGGNIYSSATKNYIYIGLEFHGLDSNALLEELPPGIRAYSTRSHFFRTLVHEMVHIQQFHLPKKYLGITRSNDLASLILLEGIPEFISRVFVPEGPEAAHFIYGRLYETELKSKLLQDLRTNDSGYWIYNGGMDIGIPRDLGYFMGAQMAQAYCKKQKLRVTEYHRLLKIKSPSKFIQESLYFDHSKP